MEIHTTIIAESLPIDALFTLDYKEERERATGLGRGYKIYVRIPALPPPVVLTPQYPYGARFRL